MKYLFVGGPADGQWLKADRPHWRVASTARRVPLPSEPAFSLESSGIDVHEYTAERFVSGDVDTLVYRHDATVKAGEVLDRLLLGYRPLDKPPRV